MDEEVRAKEGLIGDVYSTVDRPLVAAAPALLSVACWLATELEKMGRATGTCSACAPVCTRACKPGRALAAFHALVDLK